MLGMSIYINIHLYIYIYIRKRRFRCGVAGAKQNSQYVSMCVGRSFFLLYNLAVSIYFRVFFFYFWKKIRLFLRIIWGMIKFLTWKIGKIVRLEKFCGAGIWDISQTRCQPFDFTRAKEYFLANNTLLENVFIYWKWNLIFLQEKKNLLN